MMVAHGAGGHRRGHRLPTSGAKGMVADHPHPAGWWVPTGGAGKRPLFRGAQLPDANGVSALHQLLRREERQLSSACAVCTGEV
ncbi:MAG: hypothetical protein ACLU38_15195 [Dysosmobacter sp.]